MPDLINDLEITSLVHGGRGLGRIDGKAVFVPLSMPGDRVSCRVVKAKKNFIEAELCDILMPSAQRREPPCPYFGTCGGCQWQHLPYAEQARWKEQIFADLLLRQRICGVNVVRPIIAAPQEWRYRNRVQFKCHLAPSGLAIGFYRHGSHYVVDVGSCELLQPEIQKTHALLRDELPGCPHPGAVPQVDIAVGDDNAVRVVLHALPDVREQLKPWLQDLAVRHGITACLQAGRKTTLETLYGEPDLAVVADRPPLSLRYGPGGFAQVNSAQNRRMVEEMLNLLELQGHETVLDLFCGMGNFSLPLARRAKKVIGAEDYAPSIESARRNAKANGIGNAEFHVGDAAAFISRYKPGEVDIVTLDPPRTGSYEAVKALLALQPEKILYVSCDPATLARDLKPLVHGGYTVASARPIDLFPQTWHIESMTLLVAGD